MQARRPQLDELLQSFIYPEILPMSVCDSPIILFLSRPTVSSSSTAGCGHKSRPAWKDRKAFKKKKWGEKKTVKEGKTLAGLSLSFSQQKTSGHPSQAYLLTQGYRKSSQLAGSTRMKSGKGATITATAAVTTGITVAAARRRKRNNRDDNKGEQRRPTVEYNIREMIPGKY